MPTIVPVAPGAAPVRDNTEVSGSAIVAKFAPCHSYKNGGKPDDTCKTSHTPETLSHVVAVKSGGEEKTNDGAMSTVTVMETLSTPVCSSDTSMVTVRRPGSPTEINIVRCETETPAPCVVTVM